jgi:predicted kinase
MGRKIYCTSVEFNGGSAACAIEALMIIIFGGLPGTGKTAIARPLTKRTGRFVVADSVNPIAMTRDAYRAVAEREGVDVLEMKSSVQTK